MQDSIVFYTDAPPLLEGGHGNHGIAFQIINSLGNQCAFILTRKFRRSISKEAIQEAAGNYPLILHPDAAGYGFKKISTVLSGILDILIFTGWIFFSKDIRSDKRKWFILCGADYWFLFHVLLLQKIRIPTNIYFVDEIQASAKKNNLPKWLHFWVRKTLSFVLKNSHTVFAISEGFVDYLKKEYQCDAKWLPLTISSPPCVQLVAKRKLEKEKKIVFTGALNDLYLDGLKDLYEEIVAINSTHYSRNPWHLEVLSYNPPNRLLEILPHSKYLVYHYNLSSQERILSLSQASACFLPYSFCENNKVMVSTSFSCKIVEYFLTGCAIVVYGPKYSSISKYFVKENLPFCASNKKELRQVLHNLDSINDADYLQKYRAVWMRHHSPTAFMKYFQDALTIH